MRFPQARLVDVATTSVNANAMETSRSRPKAIQEQYRGDDHVRSGRRSPSRDDAMTQSVEVKDAWQWQAGGRERHKIGRKMVEGRFLISNSQSNSQPRHDTVRWQPGNMAFSRWGQRGSFGRFASFLILVLGLWILPTAAIDIQFENCLSDSAQKDEPLQLQLMPLFMDAVFDTENENHTLFVRVWVNVTGSGPERRIVPQDLPPWDDGYWTDLNDTGRGGKIIDEPNPELRATNESKATTLFNKVNVLTYEPWSNNGGERFCDVLVNGSCPLAPRQRANGSVRSEWPSFGFNNSFFSTYAFTSFTPTLLVKYGDPEATTIGCISAEITPDLGTTLTNLMTYMPLLILILNGIATAFAGIFSPWGSSDTFRWTSNYGRDEDLLRLVTPGFGDCLQYIQFITLTGALTLNYPGFYQPVASQVAWSTLMFNESFVTNGPPTISLVDGVYVTWGRYGLDKMRQLVGMSAVEDVWAGMAIWLLVIIAATIALIQIAFFLRWVYRVINKTQEEDLRAKNMPFTVGNVVRIVFNYFLFPIITLSMFQLVEFNRTDNKVTIALAVVMLGLIFGFAVWLLYFIASIRPKSYLFDDLPTVLRYGPLYNTYSDEAAAFALIPVLLSILRGVAIGALQASGIAQLVVLAICEVIFILTLHAFRPFQSSTSMVAFHTIFSSLRLTTVILMLAFAPSLGITAGPKGWIGYAILLTHASVLILGFLLNAVQTIVEVAARMTGAGGNASNAARGGLVRVFGMRQLSKRMPRRDGASRQSQLSRTAMLDAENDRKAYMLEGGRLRSQSAGSTGVLLNRQSTFLDQGGIEAYGAIPSHALGGGGGSSYTPTTPGEASTFSFLPSAAVPSGLGRNRTTTLDTAEASDPYYRPPRFRRPTLESPGGGSARTRGSWASGDWTSKRWSQVETGAQEPAEEGPSISGRVTPVAQPAALDGSPGRSKADYTTREVDFYYGVRGPALNANVPSRRIKTGPADPTGPAASAAGWFKGFFGGKTKEKGKGFEVVRSARMPPKMMKRPGEESPPEGVPVAQGVVRNGPIDSDDESIRGTNAGRGENTIPSPESAHENENLVSPLGSDDEDSHNEDEYEMHRLSDIPPTLPGMDLPGGGIELPSRFPSKATTRASKRSREESREQDVPPLIPGLPTRVPSRKPSVPRKSSRRKSQMSSVDLDMPGAHPFLQSHRSPGSPEASRLPFQRSPSHHQHQHSMTSTNSSMATPEPSSRQHSRNHSSALGNLSADFLDDRPTSVGFVHHHSIQTINPSRENPDFLGAEAEVVDGRTNSGASSLEHQDPGRN
ncbi:hypothetical protein HYFRA_00006010 [Hymenoscyphus fraxineus]|uniref:ML-like domain-containing protein n=1 Tax=Hymenoscyphus fraxineus TaxID=746836 RepID=A0A9N9PTC9_9HELO|nr:hypothetical protein HYFRA_00006010 [Hymenoscyphus fraxineus]